LEQRIAAIEDRLAKLEHFVADLREASRTRANTPERARPNDEPRTETPRY
jgi:hypothetical protein